MELTSSLRSDVAPLAPCSSRRATGAPPPRGVQLISRPVRCHQTHRIPKMQTELFFTGDARENVMQDIHKGFQDVNRATDAEIFFQFLDAADALVLRFRNSVMVFGRDLLLK
jgi:hypothetical protein